MTSETASEIRDSEISKQIFEDLPKDSRPGWAGLVLSRFDGYIPSQLSDLALELYAIIDNKARWEEAEQKANEICAFGSIFLEQFNISKFNSYFRLTRLVGIVTSNASKQTEPMDNSSGHRIASSAILAAMFVSGSRLEDEVKSAILLFRENKKLKDNITAKDFSLYMKIGNILWCQWPPIDENNWALREGYKRYILDIFEVVKAKADRQEIANFLYKLGTENMRVSVTIEDCLEIADKMLAPCTR